MKLANDLQTCLEKKKKLAIWVVGLPEATVGKVIYIGTDFVVQRRTVAEKYEVRIPLNKINRYEIWED